MSERVIADAGPLLALIEPRDEHHDWAVARARTIAVPMRTCEAALVEAAHLLRRSPESQDRLLAAVVDGRIVVEFDLAGDVAAVRKLMRKYRDRPMSLADACLVRMSERFPDHAVWTVDSDFHVYRKDGGAPIRLLVPPRR